MDLADDVFIEGIGHVRNHRAALARRALSETALDELESLRVIEATRVLLRRMGLRKTIREMHNTCDARARQE